MRSSHLKCEMTALTRLSSETSARAATAHTSADCAGDVWFFSASLLELCWGSDRLLTAATAIFVGGVHIGHVRAAPGKMEQMQPEALVTFGKMATKAAYKYVRAPQRQTFLHQLVQVNHRDLQTVITESSLP
jgi:hypothetical protein